jgi:hypothetical protein
MCPALFRVGTATGTPIEGKGTSRSVANRSFPQHPGRFPYWAAGLPGAIRCRSLHMRRILETLERPWRRPNRCGFAPAAIRHANTNRSVADARQPGATAGPWSYRKMPSLLAMWLLPCRHSAFARRSPHCLRAFRPTVSLDDVLGAGAKEFEGNVELPCILAKHPQDGWMAVVTLERSNCRGLGMAFQPFCGWPVLSGEAAQENPAYGRGTTSFRCERYYLLRPCRIQELAPERPCLQDIPN